MMSDEEMSRQSAYIWSQDACYDYVMMLMKALPVWNNPKSCPDPSGYLLPEQRALLVLLHKLNVRGTLQ